MSHWEAPHLVLAMANFRVVPIFSVSEEIFLSKSKVHLHLSRQPSIAEIVVNLNVKYLNVNVNVSPSNVSFIKGSS